MPKQCPSHVGMADGASFNRAAAAWVRQLGPVHGDGIEVRVLRLHDVAPGARQSMALHAHAWFELSVVHGGAIAYQYDGVERVVGANATFVMPPGLRHAWRQRSGTPVITGYQLAISPSTAGGRSGLERWYARVADGGWTLPRHILPAALIAAMHGLTREEATLGCQLLRAHLLWTFGALGATPAADDGEDDALAQLRDRILAQPAAPLRLTTEARRLGLSPRHLNRRFAALTGQPLHRYLVEQRLAHAAQSLLRSDLSVAAVGRSIGYDEASSFSRLFRRRFGASPQRWRQAARPSH